MRKNWVNDYNPRTTKTSIIRLSFAKIYTMVWRWNLERRPCGAAWTPDQIQTVRKVSFCARYSPLSLKLALGQLKSYERTCKWNPKRPNSAVPGHRRQIRWRRKSSQVHWRFCGKAQLGKAWFQPFSTGWHWNLMDRLIFFLSGGSCGIWPQKGEGSENRKVVWSQENHWKQFEQSIHLIELGRPGLFPKGSESIRSNCVC